ncbi:hypothetical protein SAMN02910292_02862 [Lachnospiraceae bacterium XBB2008]|nr:hypothetical protein SAMN02910292_02862 [Lachnospiraceae bacterium XBB2008]
MNEFIKDITIEYIKNTEIGANLFKIIELFQRVQEDAYAYVSSDDPTQLKLLRIGTALAFSVIRKLFAGKAFKDFDNEDWNDIAESIEENAILIDGQAYSVMIFTMYANYLDFSVKVLTSRGVSGNKCEAIGQIANEVRDLGKQLSAEEIGEADYTERCLWLLLEAMIKLLAAYGSLLIGEEKAEFAEAVMMYSFEYGRLTLYKQEQAILSEYLEHQGEVDAELDEKLSAYKELLEQRIAEFDNLMDHAFDSDLPTRLRASADIAILAGAGESEVLDSVEKIDTFFL